MITIRSRYIRKVGVLFSLMLVVAAAVATRSAYATHSTPAGCFDPSGTPLGIVVLDPGHGGSDRGAYNETYNLKESDVVLDLAFRTKDRLTASGYRVCLTRTTPNVNPSNTQRAQYANEVHGDVFVLIHLNGSTNKDVNYTSTFWGKKSKDLRLSEHMLGYLQDLTVAGGDFVGQFASGALLKSNMEATLTESAFLTNDAEAKLLADESTTGTTRRDTIAQALANGISTWAGSQTPK